jgi:hypothetical protein
LDYGYEVRRFSLLAHVYGSSEACFSFQPLILFLGGVQTWKHPILLKAGTFQNPRVVYNRYAVHEIVEQLVEVMM